MDLTAFVQFADGTSANKTLHFDTCVAIGYAGRDQQSVRKHVEELARIGVPSPATIPSMYWVSPTQILCTDAIQVIGKKTSAEIEFFIAPDENGRLYVTVVSDHSDRELESVSVSKAKQICPKIIGSVFWAYDELKEHWESLQLTCRAWTPEPVLYQQATTGSLLAVETLRDLAAKDAPCPGPTSFCSGTVPVVGGALIYANKWELRLEDPVLGRAIVQTYSVTCLDDRN